ncbi:MAG: hypothetical protein QOI51_1705, partial [Nocardioidaceae bacterium]|nr:hypothetical protein [Nocardioidaceae bacterium]
MGRGRVWASLASAGLCLTACGGGNSVGVLDTPTGMTPHDAVARVLASLGDPMVRGVDVIPAPGIDGCGSPCLRVRLSR